MAGFQNGRISEWQDLAMAEWQPKMAYGNESMESRPRIYIRAVNIIHSFYLHTKCPYHHLHVLNVRRYQNTNSWPILRS
jgi:hypothetical protein